MFDCHLKEAITLSKKNGNAGAAVAELTRPVSAPPAGDLAVMDQLPASKFDDKDCDKISGGSYLPRLMLYGSNSDAVKEELVQIGYSLVEGKDNFTYLGREVDLLCIAKRPKAIEMGDQIIANHNINSPDFKRIKDRADHEKNSMCMYGPEFLVWLPAVGKFATFLMGSKTARNEAPKLIALVRKPATVKTKLYENKDYKWHGPAVFPCSTPFDMPDTTEMFEKVTEFNNPKESEIEGVDPGKIEGGDGGRAR